MEDFSTLLLGETGTGKTAAARAIGLANFIPYDPKTKRFKEGFIRSLVALNLAEYPVGLIESQLFGHKRGAFTGAIDSHQGVFGRCSVYGSVFIDEIGDVDLPTQIKLLTVLQERTFTPVGSQEKLRFHGRVIAATNKDLEDLRTTGHFRDDFYYRLCSDVITLPPLRQRIAENPGELRLILDALIKKTIGEQSERFAERIEQRIRECLPPDYPWPGNVRELEQCVRRICLTGSYFGDKKLRPEPSEFQKNIEQGNLTAVQLLSAYCQTLYQHHGSYEDVARITALDRRTVKKYVYTPAVAR
jgi:transcriptional regulator with GAF, ATPase, and Fis domain